MGGSGCAAQAPDQGQAGSGNPQNGVWEAHCGDAHGFTIQLFSGELRDHPGCHLPLLLFSHQGLESPLPGPTVSALVQTLTGSQPPACPSPAPPPLRGHSRLVS